MRIFWLSTPPSIPGLAVLDSFRLLPELEVNIK